MIDFRYHLVSLISVFLALAVGVVLGAGPLQNSLGTALNDQVTSLRDDRNATQAQLEKTETAVNDRDTYITALADAYVPASLEGKSVVLAVMEGASDEDVEEIHTQLENAGATDAGRVTLTSAWTDLSRETYRSTYAGQFLSQIPDSSNTGDAVLGEGLALALTADTEQASTLMDLLTASETPLVTFDAEPSAAELVVVVGTPAVETDDEEATAAPTAESDVTAWANSLSGLASVATTVVVGAADSDADVVAALRAANAEVTTIDGIGQATAAVSVPLALANAADGEIVAYGFAATADEVLPVVSVSSDQD